MPRVAPRRTLGPHEAVDALQLRRDPLAQWQAAAQHNLTLSCVVEMMYEAILPGGGWGLGDKGALALRDLQYPSAGPTARVFPAPAPSAREAAVVNALTLVKDTRTVNLCSGSYHPTQARVFAPPLNTVNTTGCAPDARALWTGLVNCSHASRPRAPRPPRVRRRYDGRQIFPPELRVARGGQSRVVR